MRAAATRVGHHEVEVAVAVEVAPRHRGDAVAGAILGGMIERSIAASEQDRGGVAALGHRKILVAVAIEVTRDQRAESSCRIFPARLKGSIADAEENRDCAVGRNARRQTEDQIEFAVRIHVGRDDPDGSETAGVVHVWLEGPISVAPQHRDRPDSGGDRQVRVAIPVEVRGHQGGRVSTG